MSSQDNIHFSVKEIGASVNNPNNANTFEDTLKTSITNNDSMQSRIETYVKKNKPYICFLTPCYGGVCHVNFFQCMIETFKLLSEFNIRSKIEFCKNDSLVTRARNNLIAKAMFDPDVTHFMFIDSDITWSPVDVVKLLIGDKYLIGGVYPLKHYYFDKLIPDPKNPKQNIAQSWIDKKNNSQLKEVISDAKIIQHNLLRYNVNFLSNVLNIENNLTKVRHIATGFMMIKRATIEQLIQAYPSTKYTDDVSFLRDEENKYAYALFDCGVEEGHYFSEDWLFCHRWTKLGGNVYLDVSINLTHTGAEDYAGSFISSII